MINSNLQKNSSGAGLINGNLKENNIKNSGELSSGVKHLHEVVTHFFNTVGHFIAPEAQNLST